MIGMFVFMGAFLHLLAGAIPLIFLAGGAMAAYLGYEDVTGKLHFIWKTEAPETSIDSVGQLRSPAPPKMSPNVKLEFELDKVREAALKEVIYPGADYWETEGGRGSLEPRTQGWESRPEIGDD
jgi:hypothetical protein